MVLQHTVQYHEARHWTWLQDQFQLTYQALLSHCQLLKSHCEQYQKAKEKGQADLTGVTSTASSIHINTLSTFPQCNKCGYSHPHQVPISRPSMLHLQWPQSLYHLMTMPEDPETNPLPQKPIKVWQIAQGQKVKMQQGQHA